MFAKYIHSFLQVAQPTIVTYLKQELVFKD